MCSSGKGEGWKREDGFREREGEGEGRKVGQIRASEQTDWLSWPSHSLMLPRFSPSRPPSLSCPQVRSFLLRQSPSAPHWVGPFSQGLHMCAGDTAWPHDWERLFEEAAGADIGRRQRNTRRRVKQWQACRRFVSQVGEASGRHAAGLSARWVKQVAGMLPVCQRGG